METFAQIPASLSVNPTPVTCTSEMDWPVIGDQPVEIPRLAEISGRSEEYILNHLDRIRNANKMKMPELPVDFSGIYVLELAMATFLKAKDKREKTFALVRWLQLCQTEKQFQEISPYISTGTELELLLLYRVSRICPGE